MGTWWERCGPRSDNMIVFVREASGLLPKPLMSSATALRGGLSVGCVCVYVKVKFITLK